MTPREASEVGWSLLGFFAAATGGTVRRAYGRAVTIELLRKRFTPEPINPLWLHAMRGEGRVSVPCPSCRQPMIGVAFPPERKLTWMSASTAILSGLTLTK